MEKLKYIPAIDRLKNRKEYKQIEADYDLSGSFILQHLKEVVADLRDQLLRSEEEVDVEDDEGLHAYIYNKLEESLLVKIEGENLQRVINATGVVLHTNLGRARLGMPAVDQLLSIAENYSTLEYDLVSGERGSRHSIVETYLKELTGAEAAIVVNNNAAAVYFVLKALASQKEVIVSRGELVEIGGSFRVSDIMELSQAEIVEVGTTNKTKLADYEKAMTEETGMILKVHKSNFAMIGFTEEVEAASLAELAKENELPLYEDLGSGTLYDFHKKGIGHEPTVKEQVEKGIDLISFSGDKLLGGPQAGIIVGKKKYIDQLKQHQLARVLRIDKFTLAGLEATLKSYMFGKEAYENPTIRDILADAEEISEKAQTFIHHMDEYQDSLSIDIKEGKSKVGGGTMPEVELETYLVEVLHHSMKSSDLAKKLRYHSLPIIVRVQDDKVVMDFRTVTKEEVLEVVEGFKEII